VQDYLLHFDVRWVDDAGDSHQHAADEYFLLLLDWLRDNHPQAARQWMERVAFQIARVKYGIDSAEMIG
jgi:hypothetical protein